MNEFTPIEMMTVAAARALSNGDVCFAGVGPPSEACNLARLTHAPDIVLIYESGTIGAKPHTLPLSVGDGQLCETAVNTLPVSEVFRHWLQGGRIPVGVLGAAQIDRFGNINTTVGGNNRRPKVRLPGGGGAPEIASCCDQVLITVGQSKRSFVEKLDFVTTYGHGAGFQARRDAGFTTKGPTAIFTDLAVWKPDPDTREFKIVSLHPGTSREQVADSVGWKVKYADQVEVTPPPSAVELERLRGLHARTQAALVAQSA